MALKGLSHRSQIHALVTFCTFVDLGMTQSLIIFHMLLITPSLNLYPGPIRKSVCFGDQKMVEIDQLLCFEPYTCFDAEILRELFENHSDKLVSEAFLNVVSKTTHTKVDQLKQALRINNATCCKHLHITNIVVQHSQTLFPTS